jgi:adenylate cyclase
MAKALDLQADNLAILNLSHNPITRFTVLAADTASALTHLDLSHSRLETIPEELFTTCVSLQLLSINNNKIRTLSENVGDLQRLGTLSIKNNALQSLPASIGKLQRLHTLEVSCNKLSVLPDTIWQCSELETLNASFNNLVEFPDAPILPNGTPDEVDRSLSQGTARPAPALGMSLKRLYLAYNRLRDDVLRPLSYMPGLIVLNLSFNDIYEIPNGMLRKCYQLTHLYLSGNMLTSLPADDLERLIHLRVLHLNGNKLQTLPAELGSIQTLQVLDVGSNALKYNIANWPYDWNW